MKTLPVSWGAFLMNQAPFLMLLLISIPLWTPSLGFGGDTIYGFQVFYGFYTNLFFHQEIAHWLPYSMFGSQFDYYQLCYLSPAHYFIAFLGAFLRIQSVDILFKLAMLIQESFLVFGGWLLCGEIFEKNWARLFVCLGLAGTILWYPQINFNFRTYYLLPLMIYGLLRFYQDENPKGLWISILAFFYSQIGCVAYLICINTFWMVYFGGWVFLSKPRLIKKVLQFKKDYWSWGLFLSALLLGACFFYMAFHMLDETISYVPGRDGKHYTVDLKQFLTSGPDHSIQKGWQYFLPVAHLQGYAVYYSGILTMIFFAYSLLSVRRKIFFVFAIWSIIWFCFGLGKETFVATLVYQIFPPIRFTRYLGSFGGDKFLALILAGFGFEQFIQQSHRWMAKGKLLACAIAVIAISLYGQKLFVGRINFQIKGVEYAFILGFAGAGILACIFLQRKHLAAGIIVLCLALDLLIFQKYFFDHWPDKTTGGQDILKVYPFKYQEVRGAPSMASGRASFAFTTIKNSPWQLIPELYQFVLYDPCFLPHYLRFHWVQGVDRLLNDRFSYYNGAGEADFETHPDRLNFGGVFGCLVPKLRLIEHGMFVENEMEGERYLKANPQIGTFVLIESQQHDKGVVKNELNTAGQILVKEFSFNQLKADTEVPSPEGAWLYYADAYRRGWHAEVNGKEVQVYPANIAFKAIHLNSGKSHVRFHYWDGWVSLASQMMVCFSAFLTMLLWFWMAKIIFKTTNKKNSNETISV